VLGEKKREKAGVGMGLANVQIWSYRSLIFTVVGRASATAES
jgi:hypothetical protein